MALYSHLYFSESNYLKQKSIIYQFENIYLYINNINMHLKECILRIGYIAINI